MRIAVTWDVSRNTRGANASTDTMADMMEGNFWENNTEQQARLKAMPSQDEHRRHAKCRRWTVFADRFLGIAKTFS
ncbi:hypothetical protein BVX99_00845 [bacterium F16]|nr:hypothetical protein BVX99_00845 [bacterium F16]